MTKTTASQTKPSTTATTRALGAAIRERRSSEGWSSVAGAAETGSHSWAAFGPREVEKQWEMMRDVENSFPLVRGRF